MRKKKPARGDRRPRWRVQVELGGNGKPIRLDPFAAWNGGVAKTVALIRLKDRLYNLLGLEMKTPIKAELVCISNSHKLGKRKFPPAYMLRRGHECVGSVMSARHGSSLFVEKQEVIKWSNDSVRQRTQAIL